MEIKFKNKGFEKVCTNYGEAIKAYGKKLAVKIHQRMKEFQAAETEQDLFFIDRCHTLSGKRKTQYSVELGQPYRLVFELVSKEPMIIKIIEIEDYHGKK